MPSPSTASRSQEGGADPSASASNTSSSARAAAEVIAITTRDDFLLEIGEAMSGQTSVRPVDSVATALEQIQGSRKVQLLAIDARDVDDLRGDIEQVNSQAPHIVALVFANADVEKQTAISLKGTTVFAVLPIPIDKRKTGAVFEGAIADATARRPQQSARPSHGNDPRFDKNTSITVEAAQADHGHYGPSLGSDSGGKNPMVMIGGGVAALLVAAGAAWFFMRSPSAPTAAPADKKASVSVQADDANVAQDNVVAEAAPVVEMPLVNGTVDELLEKARMAMRERRYTEPNGDNALLYYRSAAKADASNGEASDGLKRVASVLTARFEEALTGARYEEATLALAHLKAATPDDKSVTALDGKLATAQVNRMLADSNLDRAASLVKGAQQSGAVSDSQITKWRNEINRRQDEQRQKRLVDLATDRIRDGRLAEGDDSAKAYLQQLRDLGPSASNAAARVSRDLGGAYMRKARESALTNRQSDVDRYLTEAKSVGVSSAELNNFQKDLNNAKQRAATAEADRLAGLARDRLRENKLTDPANDSAAFYLTALQGADANNAVLVSGSRELATKLLDRASTASREGRTAQVDADLTQARRWGADPKDIQAIQQASASRKNASKPSGSAATASSNSSGGGAASAPADLQSKLKRIRYSAPEFPERALTQRISGSVTVEFVVSTTGEPTEVRVVSAEPAGTFDRSAMSAVKRWRYEPVIINNVPQDVPARATIRFALPSN
ncbi:MAG: energy transducer TonB [Gammaproteobacteria bacterium]